MADEYARALEDADADPEVRAVVLTGAGRAFCAGADLEILEEPHRIAEQMARVPTFPLAFRKPLIGAVNGVAAGLGMVQALYCDVRFAAPTASFLTAFAHRGLVAEYGVSWLLPQLVGRSRALDLLLSSRRVDAAEAHRIGLVDHRVDEGDVVEAAVEYAAGLAERSSPTSMAVIKMQVADDADGTFEEAMQRATPLMNRAFTGPDVAEGVASFQERRAPQFPPLGPVTGR